MEKLRLFIRLSRPLFLIGIALLYALGVGIARYLGHRINWEVYLVGQLWVSLLQLSTHYLNEYYNAPADSQNPNRTFLTGGSGAIGEGKLSRRVALMAALVCLAVLASLTVLISAQIAPSAVAYVIMGLAFVGAMSYSMPPLSLESSGYGELTASVLSAFLVPVYAFILQTGEMHPLVAMNAFPLTALCLAMFLALELPDYGTDLKFNKRTLLVRLGWQNGMFLHNLLVLSAFLLLVLARSVGLPWFAMLAGLLALPVGAFQVLMMRNIARGAKPNWNAITLVAVASFTLMAYFMAFAFWTH